MDETGVDVHGSVLAGVPIEEVETELVLLAGNLAAGECRWLLLLAEVERRGTWKTTGFRSVTQWLSMRLGVTSRTARAKLAVARRLDDLPSVTAAWSNGEVSYSQVRAITRAIPDGADPARERGGRVRERTL